jgi:ATP-binding cassette subfamily B protein
MSDNDMKKPQMGGRRPMGGPMGGPMGRPGMGMGTGAKAKDFKGSMKRLLGYLKPQFVIIIIVISMAILSQIFNVVSPKILGKITTAIFTGIMLKAKGVPGAGIDFVLIKDIVLQLIVIYFISAFFSYIQNYLMTGVSQKIVFNMRNQINDKLTRLPLKYFDKNSKGDILSRITNDVDNISNTLQQSLTQIITAIVTLIGVLIMMLSISPTLTLIAFCTIPLCLIVTVKIAGKSQKYFTQQWSITGKLNGHIEEMYSGHSIVKVFGHEQKAIDDFKVENQKLYDVSWKAQFISGIIMPLMSFINNLAYVVLCVLGGIRVASGTMTIGDVQAFVQYSKQFTQPINQTANIANIMQSAVASAERIFELLDEQEEVVESDAKELINANGNITFEQVKFGYNEENILIENMNIDVKAGQTVAIVGPTGAGKTTIVNLLMRFYELNSGKITVDGIDITDIKRSNLRKTFGMVLQDTWLFEGTVKDNIAYGREGATDEQIIAAAKAAHVHHFIKTLEKGYDTVLNEDATNISQGQKQLLTIARAILADPTILILDEATSSVDTRTEILIQKAMNNLMKGRTSFVIAHRLSTIKEADIILVMNKGSIIEQGNHQQLLEQNGFYADLYNSQFSEDFNEAI